MDVNRVRAKLSTMVAFAADLSTLSCCKAAKCGAVAFPRDFSEVFGIGYNGPAMGRPNGACTAPELQPGELARCGCVHAEASLQGRMGRSGRPAILVSTTAPCPHCAGILINSRRVFGVVWLQPYWSDDGLQQLNDVGIITADWLTLRDSEQALKAFMDAVDVGAMTRRKE